MTEQRIIEIIEANIEKQCQVTPDSRLRDDLGVDSLGVVILMNAFEEAFDIEIPDDVFKDIQTVRDITLRLEAVLDR